MRKVGLMGGTFDPIHMGHLIIAQQALTLLPLDEVWFMPAGDPPHKDNTVTAKEKRLKMVELAIEDNPDFKLFTYETDKERPSYSAITLTELDELYSDIDFYFILGADSLLSLHKWYHPEIICAHARIIAANRNNVQTDRLEEAKANLKQLFNAEVYIIDTPQIDISSTKIRNLINEGRIKETRYMLTEKVYDYILSGNIPGMVKD